MALEAAKGMLYLHSRAEPVLHRDLKSANLLVDKHWHVKVADFNLSRVMNASAVVSSVSATNPRRALLAPLVQAIFCVGITSDVQNRIYISSASFPTLLLFVAAMEGLL